MKSLLSRTLFHGSLIASLVLPGVQVASAQQYNSLVKGSGPAVYFFSMDGKRYAFPNYDVFKSWYPGSSNITVLKDDQLATMPLGGNVTFKPGVALVKVTTDPKVYAISKGGLLRWVSSEAVARDLYGADWNKKVFDVADVFFINYRMGAAINQSSDYYPMAEAASVNHPGENLPTSVPTSSSNSSGTPTSSTPVKGLANVSVSLSSSQATLNQTVTISASVSMTSAPIQKLEIFRESSLMPLASCSNTNQCVAQLFIQAAPAQERFYAVATNVNGEQFRNEISSLLTIAAVSNNLQTTVTPQSVTVGSRASFSAIVTSNLITVESHKVFARIPGVAQPVLWKDCKAQSTCAGSTVFYRGMSLYSQVVSQGQTYISPDATIEVLGSAPKPVLSIVNRPSPNQVTFQIVPPNGEGIGVTSLAEGSIESGTVLSLCDQTCTITIQVTEPIEITAYTPVGGAYERSETFEVKPQ